jgi:undecaprenyl-diphosphatase
MTRQAGHEEPVEEPAGDVARFEVRVAVGVVGLLVAAVPFLALVLLVRQEWAPLRELDEGVAAELNEQANASPVFVDVVRVLTDFGGNVFAIYVFLLTAAWFWIRRQRRMASFVATTGIGLAIIVPVTKLLVGRDRPEVLLPVSEIPTNASFPSGHAMVATVTAGMLALVLLPAVARRWRPLLVAVAVLLAVVVGFTRLALGVHFVSDVVAGWALGVGWLAIMVGAFRVWQRDHGVRVPPVREGVDPQAVEAQHVHADVEPVLPRGRTTVLQLAASAAGIFVLLSALGLLVTSVLGDTALGRWDREVVRELGALRTPERSDIAKTIGALSGTPMVIALSVAVAVLGLAVRASWRPVVFVATTVLGEVLLYWVTTQVVGRARPAVPDLTSGLPVGGSWPSGHGAAAVAVYGSLAAVVIVYGRARWRWAVLALPLLVPPLIGIARLYVAAHYPTDVLAGLLLGTLWLLACVRFLLLPGRGTPADVHPPAEPDAVHAPAHAAERA